MNFNRKGHRESVDNNALFKAIGIALLVIVPFFIVADIKIYQKKRELLSQAESYKKQIQDIQKNSQTLREEIANSNNVDYLEKIAYEQLGQQKPGEKEVIFVGPKDVQKEPQKPTDILNVRSWGAWLMNGLSWIKSWF